MAITNTVATIKRKSSTGHGSFSKTVVGQYSIWLEQSSVSAQRRIGSITNEQDVPEGTFFLFEDIDLTDCYIDVDGTDRPITAFDRFIDRKGDFHHIEGAYSK